MGKRLFIAEKPSVAKEFARVFGVSGRAGDGFLESDDSIVTWCVGHLVTMSYPEKYDKKLKDWSEDTLPFLPDKFKYEIIPQVKKQFDIVSGLLNRDDVDTIYVCTDSGREGEYIYRLVDMQAGVPDTKKKLRVWIDSQTDDEIKRGVNEAKPVSEYDALSDSAYLRAKEDYLMGINFSRILSVKYGRWLNNNISSDKWSSISVGRVMSCVLGMVVRREWEIRRFIKTPFYRVISQFSIDGDSFDAEWHVCETSKYYEPEIITVLEDEKKQADYSLSRVLYKENGFRDEKTANELIDMISAAGMDEAAEGTAVIRSLNKKQEEKNPPLLFNLAELQNLSSKLFKISPDETLQIVQDLYEKKLVTYPRTDARVLSTAVAKDIAKNLNGLKSYTLVGEWLNDMANRQAHKGLEKTRYVDDKKITDHYAIIPTGAAIGSLSSMSELHQRMYEVIVRRFLSIFFPPAVYQRLNVEIDMKVSDDGRVFTERFVTGGRVLVDEGFFAVNKFSFTTGRDTSSDNNRKNADAESEDDESEQVGKGLELVFDKLKKGASLRLMSSVIKEGETSPPKRYNSGSMILAMENAGQMIEDEELRAQIKGSGIGTSATRAEILKKLFTKKYLSLNKKTQIITPSFTGEMVYGVIYYSM
ncbi:MAG: type IA DNA topoisomerase, partial [Eubacterium sp.]|nr:type IA DNA topoisomerase [Eubacterium sp.]